ncbi:MAG: MCE family protein [Gammaproteobacteria bacterium]|nr:MCE family protein [Gammaproteobacteria bacterium]
MGNRVHYTVVGLFVVLLSCAGMVIFYWLSVRKHDQTYSTYLVYVHEDVTGLTVQSPVRFNGVSVGYVDKMTLDPTNPQLVRLVLKIAENTPVTTSTVASLNSQGITGIIYVGLKAETVNAPPLLPKPGEPYPVIPAKPSLLVQLSNVLPEITKRIEQVGDRVSAILSDKNQQAIANTLKNLSNFTDVLSNNSKQLNASIVNLDATLKNTAVASKQLPEIMQKFNNTLTTVQHTSASITQASQSIGHTMDTGRVAINNFSDQVVPNAQELLQNLNRLTHNLQHLSEELKQNPAVIIRGKTSPAAGPGE